MIGTPWRLVQRRNNRKKMRYWASAGIFGSAMSVAPVVAQPSADQLSGRYYLSGVMETGSELLLRPDGSFEWAVTYGAVDAAATGHWLIDGRAIRLQATRRPQSEGAAYRLGERGAWSGRATHALELRREREAIAERAARCPLPSLAQEVVPDIGLAAYGDKHPTPTEIARVEAEARRARDTAQGALDRLRRTAAWQSNEALISESEAAIQAFQARLSAAQGLHAASGTHGPELAPLKLPAECQLPDPERLARTFRGVAIQLFDRERYLRGDGIRIEARYDKRAPLSDVVERGYVFFPVGDDERIVALTLSALGMQAGERTTLPVHLPARAVQIIDADLGGTVTPPFQEIVLPVGADRSLGARALFSRGAYRKAIDASSDPGHRTLR